MTSKRSVRSRVGVCVGFAVVGAAISVVASEIGQEGAQAASVGTVSLEPASGPFTSATTFTASAPCPSEATRYLVTIQGGGVTAETNVIGAETIQDTATNTVAGVALADGDFKTFAATNSVTLSGPATVTIKCLKGIAGEVVGDLATTVTFSGTGEATTYTSGGAAPSPSPTASTSPSPSPSPDASTTPTPSPEATPDPDDATPTPAPDGDDDTDTDTDSSGSGPGDGDGPLPDTGAQDPQRILTVAALFGLTGWLLTLFEGASRPREDSW